LITILKKQPAASTDAGKGSLESIMKHKIIALIAAAARKAHETGTLASDDFPPVALEEPKIGQHGDFATNFAMLSAKAQKMAPRQIAQAIVDHL
jgi:arginyl-tRNA synthetase